MHWSRILGITFIVVGAVLLYLGWEASQTLGEEVRRELLGRFSEETTRYFVWGGGAAVMGLLLAVFGVKRR
jgi:drug/metabolite transporter (DMT)-like permease